MRRGMQRRLVAKLQETAPIVWEIRRNADPFQVLHAFPPQQLFTSPSRKCEMYKMIFADCESVKVSRDNQSLSSRDLLLFLGYK